MNNTSMIKYGSDFLIYGNEVYLSHQFTTEYLKALIFVFMMGVLIGLGASLFYIAAEKDLIPWLMSKLILLDKE
jgi:hypothetical protein